MRRWLVVVGLALGVVGVGSAASPAPAACAYCPSFTCYGNCGSGCLCMRAPGKRAGGGQCFEVMRARELEAHGWSGF